jgi:hypothetical protein
MPRCAAKAGNAAYLVIVEEQAPKEHVSALQGSLHLAALVHDVPVAENPDINAWALPLHPPGCLQGSHADVL